MLIPYGTDAPTYHYPFTTIAIIAINTSLFCLTGMGEVATMFYIPGIEEPSYRWLILEFDRINPLQWVTAAFMHASWSHLIGNMIFLWCFGLVVEGKLGWYRFTLLYLCLALAKGAITQIPMFVLGGGPGGALGASGVIFALIAVSLVWAPDNDVHCIFAPTFYYIRQLDIPIFGFALFYVALQFLQLAFIGLHMSTPMLHLLGLLVGFPAAIYMLHYDLVDCEGWDLFSRYGTGRGYRLKANPLWIAGRMLRRNRTSEDANLLASGYSRESGQQALNLIQSNPDAFNPPAGRSDSKTRSIESLQQAIRSKHAAAAMASFRKISDRWGTPILQESLVIGYAELLSRTGRHLECLVPLQILVARKSIRANRACLRIALIQLRVQHNPTAARATIRQMVKPWGSELEKKRRNLLLATSVKTFS